MDPGKAQVGKCYKLLKTIYHSPGIGSLVIVTQVTLIGCEAVPVTNQNDIPLYYASPWDDFEEVLAEISQTNSIENNSCPECRIPGEFIELMWKCPRCWKRW